MTAPVLETERLILRPHERSDFEDTARMWANPDVVRYITGTPSSEEDSWSRLMKYIGHWQMLDFGYWAVILRDTGAYAGDVGFADYKRALKPSLDGVPEAGWVLSPEVHGRGVATEAVARMHAWADEHRTWRRTCCIFDPEHQVSQKVALRLGYRPEEALGSYHDMPTLIMYRDTQS